MKFDNSDDEFGFWEPERPRRQRTPRSAAGSQLPSSRPATDEPTRQLRRTDAGRRHGSSSPAVDLSPHIAPAVARRSDANAAYLDELSELLDHDVAMAMGDDVPVVAVPPRRSWRTRLRREDGRLDPFAVRIGVVLLVGVVAIPIGAGLSGGSGAASAARPAAAVAAPSSPTPSSAGPEQTADAPVTVALTNAAAPAVPVGSAAAEQATPVTEEATTDVATTPAAPVTDEATTAAATTPDSVAAPPDSAAAAMPAPTTAAVPNGEPAPQALLAGTSRNSCTSSYTLVAGDYWLGIADRADVKLGALLLANGATSSTPLYPGRSICLPAGATTPLPPASTTTAAPTTVAPTTASPTTVPAKPTTTTKAPTTTAAKKVAATTAPTATAPKATPTNTTPKVTVAPTTTAAPTTTVAKRTYSRDQVAQIIRDVWPDDLEDKAIAIATRESNLQPQVRNFCCFGLFQIYYSVHQSWLGGIGITSADQLYDPTNNAEAALALYNRNGGWGPWGG